MKHCLPVVCAIALLLFCICGCDRGAGQNVSATGLTSLERLRASAQMGRWDDAWNHAESVEREHGDDADILAEIAKVAYASKRPGDAVRLLMAACRAESFRDEKRNGQAVIAATSVGQLYDAMEFLTKVVESQPDQFESRRLLFDLAIGMENRMLALPHGRYLIHQRRFDLDLLTSISNTESRALEAESLEEMVKRNPSDKRPLIGKAKAAFDKGEFTQAILVATEIRDQHPADVSSQVILGQALVSLGRFAELNSWADKLQGEYERHPYYWIILGDWSMHHERHQEAVRAYWEAAQRDADILEIWVRLRRSLQLASLPITISDETIRGIDNRIDQLSRFYQSKKQFTKTGSRSRRLGVEIAATLQELGRLWEAEAWLALSLGFPEEAAIDVSKVRAALVTQLTKLTPWQIVDAHPELTFECTAFELPRITDNSDLPPALSLAESDSPALDITAIYGLQDEAHERGLRFYGKTGDRVAGPGVPFYQTLGCGGGAIDYDLDGWSDVYLCAAGGTPPHRDSSPNCLFRNVEGRFVDVTEPSATGDTGFGQGVAVGDLNEDGFPDMLLLNYGLCRVLINQGQGEFVDRTEQWLPDARSAWSSSGAIADVSGDGIADAVIVNYCAGLEPVTKVCGDPKDAPGGIPRACSPLAFSGEQTVFLEGTPDGSLTDRTNDRGAIPSIVGRGLGITVGQFDGLPGLDVFVANDMTNNHYWSRAPGDSYALIESAIPRGLAGDAKSLPQGSMGIAVADMDRDGDIDFYVTNFSNEYNTYHVQEAPGVWRDRTTLAGLAQPTMPMVGFGTQALDIDNDGNLELVVSNGHVDSYEDLSKVSPYAQPMQIFRQTAPNQFESVGENIQCEYLQKPHVGRALWMLDVDRNGRLDLGVTHQTEPVALLMNHTHSRGAWLSVSLVGSKSSRDAIGAIVKVISGNQSWTATATSGAGYLSSNTQAIHFGLGIGVENVDLEIQWPSGTREYFSGLPCLKHWLLVESESPAELSLP